MIRPVAPHPNPQGFISQFFVRLLFRYLDELGMDPVELLDEPRPSTQPGEKDRYPLARFCALMERAASTLDDPLFALHLGASARLEHLGILGYVMLHTPNLGAALERLLRYYRLIKEQGSISVQIDEGYVVISWPESDEWPGSLFEEMGIAMLVQLSRDAVKTPPFAESVSFVGPRPDDVSEYEKFFGGKVYFDEPRVTIRILADYLSLPLLRDDPVIVSALEVQVERMLEELPGAGDLAGEVRRAVISMAREGEPSFTDVARKLDMTERGLYRRLAAHGLSFRTLRDEALCQVGQRYLEDPGLDIAEIALLLGYSEQSAFNRAFRRWTGFTPAQWRREHSTGEPLRRQKKDATGLQE